jgi:outer membrane protein OmpA-like peptidoglycan-associated protein
LIGLAILYVLWLLFWQKTPPPTQALPPQATAPATTMPAMVFSGFPAKVYFETGSATPGPGGMSMINAAADAIKKDNLKVAVSGYTDKTGDAAKNEELAKNRAVAVRDALKAAGVAEADIDMKPPLFVEGGASTSDAEARRVEINKM